ncbi:hypothetical protein [Myceligenerans xiligouense]|uniref:Uncharacterized protein n=1 Tax=Myceligenerans xiligouense TaxID=253184 RepID=A0A3N4YP64_9MICO|nr:hypothetical protein [Myceligenerans xiligouense]RPF21927.1 hypothetical protein EDD34_2566 [Myceligenerans xiligouense]
MPGKNIQGEALEILTDSDELEGFLIEAGGLTSYDAERVAQAITNLIEESP